MRILFSKIILRICIMSQPFQNKNHGYFDNKDTNSFLSPSVTQYGSHMVMTNVSRETKTKYWNIDTQFCDDYQQNNAHLFTLPQSIPNVKSITVLNAEIPVSFFNLSANLGNNSIQITRVSTGTISLLVLPDGYYTTDLLQTTMNTYLHAIDVSLNYTITGNYSKFTTLAHAYTFEFAVSSNTTTAGFDKYDVKSRLGWQLGFRDISYSVTSTADLQSTSFIELLKPRYLYLVIDEYSGNTSNTFVSPLPSSVLNKNILAKITMDYRAYPVGSVLPANTLNGYLQPDKRTYSGIVNLRKLQIQLVNEYGVVIDLNGMDFSFCLEIEYE